VWGTAIFNGYQLTRLEFIDGHFHSRSRCFCALGGEHAADKRYGDGNTGDGTKGAATDDERATFFWVYFIQNNGTHFGLAI
jgi:hypothetical protein